MMHFCISDHSICQPEQYLLIYIIYIPGSFNQRKVSPKLDHQDPIHWFTLHSLSLQLWRSRWLLSSLLVTDRRSHQPTLALCRQIWRMILFKLFEVWMVKQNGRFENRNTRNWLLACLRSLKLLIKLLRELKKVSKHFVFRCQINLKLNVTKSWQKN